MPPIPAPGADETATAIYGLRRPKNSRKAYKFFESISRIADDVEAALQAFGLPPVVTGTPVVALSDAARDTYWGAPATAAARRTLQDRGAITVRPDKGYSETYFAGATDGGANPGGVITPGWYPIPSSRTTAVLKKGTAQNTAAGTTGTFVAVTWGTEIHDPLNLHSTSVNTSRMTIPAGLGGLWRVVGSARIQSNATVECNMDIFINGASFDGQRLMRNFPASATWKIVTAEGILPLAAGDYIELAVNIAGTASVPIDTSVGGFSLEWIGPLA